MRGCVMRNRFKALDSASGMPARLALFKAALPFQAHAGWYARAIIESNRFCDRKLPAGADLRRRAARE